MAKTTALSLDEAVKRSPHKWVYLFSEGNATMRDLLGGKGAGVAEMTNAGLPVPPGFTITTEACNEYYHDGKQFPDGHVGSGDGRAARRRGADRQEASATPRIHCSSRCAPARSSPCPA